MKQIVTIRESRAYDEVSPFTLSQKNAEDLCNHDINQRIKALMQRHGMSHIEEPHHRIRRLDERDGITTVEIVAIVRVDIAQSPNLSPEWLS